MDDVPIRQEVGHCQSKGLPLFESAHPPEKRPLTPVQQGYCDGQFPTAKWLEEFETRRFAGEWL
jgi:hypothetical protein